MAGMHPDGQAWKTGKVEGPRVGTSTHSMSATNHRIIKKEKISKHIDSAVVERISARGLSERQ